MILLIRSMVLRRSMVVFCVCTINYYRMVSNFLVVVNPLGRESCVPFTAICTIFQICKNINMTKYDIWQNTTIRLPQNTIAFQLSAKSKAERKYPKRFPKSLRFVFVISQIEDQTPWSLFEGNLLFPESTKNNNNAGYCTSKQRKRRGNRIKAQSSIQGVWVTVTCQR